MKDTDACRRCMHKCVIWKIEGHVHVHHKCMYIISYRQHYFRSYWPVVWRRSDAALSNDKPIV